MLPAQSPTDLQNPVICMYVPSRSHQFPVVNGVTEVKNRNIENSQSEEQYGYGTNSSYHSTFRSGNQECKEDEFACEHSDKCISWAKRCDGRVDCADASDETDCSCKHRISKHRLCDGFFDCPSGEDELGCFGCDRNSFSCQDWERGREQSTCVPLSKMCDNVVDCINHRDELECALLSDSIIPHKTHFVSYSKGILHRNWKGRWYPACTGPQVTEWAIQACLADSGPLAGEPRIEMTSTEYPGPYIIPNGLEKYSLSQMCRTQKVVTYVTCPPIQCGTRVTKAMLDSSTRILEARQQYRTPGVSDEDKDEDHSQKLINTKEGEAQNEDGYCEGCNLEERKKYSDSASLIATKTREYRTQFEPTEEEYFRWNRGADDILGVVGGRRSRPSLWPWVVALYRDGKFHCGGVIINNLWVMTAAHCMDKYTRHYFEVQAGMLRRFSFSPQEQTRRVTHVVLHNLYDLYSMQNDLALLRLHSKLKFNRWVRPICLPQEHISQFGPPSGSICTAVGWGATVEGGKDPDDLYEVNVPVLPYCKHRADQEGAGLCAGYLQGGYDACQGDSGGPLLCKLPGDEERWYVAGIVSHGEGCARPNEPGVYTRVFLFIDWIKSVVNDHESLSPSMMPNQKCPGLQCNSGRRCVSLSSLCNSKVDCLNAEDETVCDENYLEKSPFSFKTSNETSVTEITSTDEDFTPLTKESHDDQITIQEVYREPHEHFIGDQNEEQNTEKKDEETPHYKNSNSNEFESKTSDKDEIRELLTTEDQTDPPHLQEENNYETTDTSYSEIESNELDSGSQMEDHEIDKMMKFIKQFDELTQHYSEVTNAEGKPNNVKLHSKSLKQKTQSDNQKHILPLLENPQEQEKEVVLIGNDHGKARANDEHNELSEVYTDENVLSLSHAPDSPTSEENCFSTGLRMASKHDEPDEIRISTLDPVKGISTLRTSENGSTVSNFDPHQELEITTASTYYKEDTLLVNELVHKDKNSSEIDEELSNVHYVSIPPYLFPILFPNKTSGVNDQSIDKQNNTSNTHGMKFKSIEDKSVVVNHNYFNSNDKEKKKHSVQKGFFPSNENNHETEVTSVSPLEIDQETTESITKHEIESTTVYTFSPFQNYDEKTTLNVMHEMEDPTTLAEIDGTTISTVSSLENDHEKTTLNTMNEMETISTLSPQANYHEIATPNTVHEMEITNMSTFPLKQHDHEITTPDTMIPTVTETFDSDSKMSEDKVINEDVSKYSINETKDFEEKCKSYLKLGEEKADPEAPNETLKSKSSDAKHKSDNHETNSNITSGSNDLSNITSKVNKKSKKREPVCVQKIQTNIAEETTLQWHC